MEVTISWRNEDGTSGSINVMLPSGGKEDALNIARRLLGYEAELCGCPSTVVEGFVYQWSEN